jgi:hypothetical protein
MMTDTVKVSAALQIAEDFLGDTAFRTQQCSILFAHVLLVGQIDANNCSENLLSLPTMLNPIRDT